MPTLRNNEIAKRDWRTSAEHVLGTTDRLGHLHQYSVNPRNVFPITGLDLAFALRNTDLVLVCISMNLLHSLILSIANLENFQALMPILVSCPLDLLHDSSLNVTFSMCHVYSWSRAWQNSRRFMSPSGLLLPSFPLSSTLVRLDKSIRFWLTLFNKTISIANITASKWTAMCSSLVWRRRQNKISW